MSVDHGFVLPRHGSEYRKPSVSVVIPVRNEYPVLFISIFSCLEELLFWGYPVEIVVVSNLSDDWTPDILTQRYEQWINRGRLKVVVWNDRPGLDVSRNKGIEAASGELIILCDAHCSIVIGSLHGLIQGWCRHGGMWFPSINCWTDWDDCRLRAYNLGLTHNFWGTQSFDVPPWAIKDGKIGLYTIPMASHAVGLIDKKTFQDVHGFHPDFRTYAGGESYLNMKLWLLGIKSWINPDSLVRHDTFGHRIRRDAEGRFHGSRGYCYSNDDIWFNFMLAAYTCGGEKWMDYPYNDAMQHCAPNEEWTNGLKKLRRMAVAVGFDDREWIAERSKYPSFDAMVEAEPWNNPEDLTVALEEQGGGNG